MNIKVVPLVDVDRSVSRVEAAMDTSSLEKAVDVFGVIVDGSFKSKSDLSLGDALSVSLNEYTFNTLYMIKSSPKANIRPRRVLRRILNI